MTVNAKLEKASRLEDKYLKLSGLYNTLKTKHPEMITPEIEGLWAQFNDAYNNKFADTVSTFRIKPKDAARMSSGVTRSFGKPEDAMNMTGMTPEQQARIAENAQNALMQDMPFLATESPRLEAERIVGKPRSMQRAKYVGGKAVDILLPNVFTNLPHQNLSPEARDELSDFSKANEAAMGLTGNLLRYETIGKATAPLTGAALGTEVGMSALSNLTNLGQQGLAGAISSGLTFGGARAMEEAPLVIRGEENIGSALKKTAISTALGVALGSTSALNSLPKQIAADFGIGYGSSKLEGASDADAALTGTLFALFKLVNAKNVKQSIKNSYIKDTVHRITQEYIDRGVDPAKASKMSERLMGLWVHKAGGYNKVDNATARKFRDWAVNNLDKQVYKPDKASTKLLQIEKPKPEDAVKRSSGVTRSFGKPEASMIDIRKQAIEKGLIEQSNKIKAKILNRGQATKEELNVLTEQDKLEVLDKLHGIRSSWAGKQSMLKQLEMLEKSGLRQKSKPKPEASYLGEQKRGDGTSFSLYNLNVDIPGHTKGSTVTKETLTNAGIKIPDIKEVQSDKESKGRVQSIQSKGETIKQGIQKSIRSKKKAKANRILQTSRQVTDKIEKRLALDEIDIPVDEKKIIIKDIKNDIRRGKVDNLDKYIEHVAVGLQDESPSNKIKVQDVPLNDIIVDREKFQNRSEAFSQETVDSIMKDANANKFNYAKFDPIKIWVNPEGKKYLLAGHSRLNAFKQLSTQGKKEFDTIPVVEYKAESLEEAIRFAKEESNALATAESEIDRANIYRSKRKSGVKEKDIREKAKSLEKKNWKFIYNLSHLNPNGKTLSSLKSMEKTEEQSKQNIRAIADWVGDARSRNEALTNAHEDEMFNYLLGGGYNKLHNKLKFVDAVSSIANNAFFDASKPLNIEYKSVKHPAEQELDAKIKDKEAEIATAKKEMEKKRKKYLSNKIPMDNINRILKKDNTKITLLQKDLLDLKQKVSGIKKFASEQPNLFGENMVSEKGTEYNIDKALIEKAKKYDNFEDFEKAMREGKAGLYVDYTPTKRLLKSNSGNKTLADVGFNPESIITIYRGIPNNLEKKINNGDYVTTSKQLAEDYAGKTKNVISKDIKVKDFYADISGITKKDITMGVNNLHLEGVYNSNKPVTKSQLKDIWNMAHTKHKNHEELNKNESYFIRLTETPEEDLERGSSVHVTDYDKQTPKEEVSKLLNIPEDELVLLDNDIWAQKIDGLAGFSLEAKTPEEAISEAKERLDEFRKYNDLPYTIYKGVEAAGDVPDGDAFEPIGIIENIKQKDIHAQNSVSEKQIGFYLKSKGIKDNEIKKATTEINKQFDLLQNIDPRPYPARSEDKIPSSVEEKILKGDFTKTDYEKAFKDNNLISALVPQLIKNPADVSNLLGKKINSTKDFGALLIPLRNPYFESVKIIYADKNNVIIDAAVVSIGNTSAAIISPTELTAIAPDGTNTIYFSHNHPSGDPSPSDIDKDITLKAKKAIELAGYKYGDHIITNGDKIYSMRQNAEFKYDRYYGVEQEKYNIVTGKKLTEQHQFSDIIKLLRQGSENANHIVYVSGGIRILGVQRIRGDNAEFKKQIIKNNDRIGASAVFIDYPTGSEEDILEIVGALKYVGINVLDSSNKEVPSFVSLGVMETPPKYELESVRGQTKIPAKKLNNIQREDIGDEILKYKKELNIANKKLSNLKRINSSSLGNVNTAREIIKINKKIKYLSNAIKKMEIQKSLPEKKQLKPIAKGGSPSSNVPAKPAQVGIGYGTIANSEKDLVSPKKTNHIKIDENIDKNGIHLVDEFYKLISPAARKNKKTISGKVILRKNLGELNKATVEAMYETKKIHRAFTFMSLKDKYDFYDRMERGLPQKTPKLDYTARVFRKMLDGRRDKIIALGKGYLENFIENYMPHIWKDSKNAKSIIGKMLSKRKLAGSKSFLKQRTIMYFMDGIDAGLEPVSDNPVDMVLLKLLEMDRFLMADSIIKDLKASGNIKFVYSKSKIPDGLVKINDPAFTIYMKPEINKKESYDYHLVDKLVDMARSLKIDTKRFVNIGGKRLGYSTGKYGQAGGEKIRTRFASPESVLAHEIGHILGTRYRLYDTIRKTSEGKWAVHKRGKNAGKKYWKTSNDVLEFRSKINEQWRALADLRVEDIDASSGFRKYIRNSREKEAVMLEALIHTPEKFKKVAPDLYKEFTGFLNNHAELRPILDIKPSLVIGENTATIKVPGFTTLGYYAVPEEIGLLINNYLSPGLRNNNNKIISNSYNMLRGVGNIINQVQLSLSGFHALNVSTDMIASTLGMGAKKLAIRGQKISGLTNIMSSPIAPVIRIWEGARIKKAYNLALDKITNPQTKMIVQAVTAVNGRNGIDAFYYNRQIKALTKTFADLMSGNAIKAIKGTAKLPFNLIGSILEVAAKPLMEWYVPTGKLGIFSMMAKSEMKRAEDGQITEEQLSDLLIKVWDSADNRMGQLIYDNLFWNKLFKDIVMLRFRSTGWTLGSWREYGGAIKGVFTTKRRLKEGEAVISHRMAYTLGALVTYAILGTVIHKILTGKYPEEVKDFFFPRTGNVNPDGSDERISLPTYAKDWYAYGTQPIKTFANKAHPMWGIINDLVTNKDFFNVKIADKEDPTQTQISDNLEYLMKELRPMSVKNFEKMRRSSDSNLKNAIISITGIVSAPSYLTKTRAQKLMTRYIVEHIQQGARSKESFNKYTYRKTIINQLRKGLPIDRKETIKRLGIRGYQSAIKEAMENVFVVSFKKLNVKEAINVYIIANKKEREQSQSVFLQKVIKNRRKLTRDEYQQAIKLARGK